VDFPDQARRAYAPCSELVRVNEKLGCIKVVPFEFSLGVKVFR